MILNQIDGKTHIRSDESRRIVGVFNPAKGVAGTLEIKRGSEVCEIDLARLLEIAGCNLTIVKE